jgi:hypothetical protein
MLSGGEIEARGLEFLFDRAVEQEGQCSDEDMSLHAIVGAMIDRKSTILDDPGQYLRARARVNVNLELSRSGNGVRNGFRRPDGRW